jgi:SPP1 gp7 family putative phage head morphogenesis protein
VSWRVPGQYSEAVEWFRQRVPMLEGEFASLDAAAKRKAFTVAGVAQLDMVHQVWQALDKALADGTTFEEFKATVGQRLAVAWGKPNPARLETIFRTNMQLAYGAGRYRQLTDPDVLETRPYWMYDAVLDSRTSSLCKRLDKTVLRHDDPFWKSHIPPLHHRCRSGLRSLTAEQAQARGVTISPPDEQASEGFGLAPDVSEWQPDPRRYPGQLWDILENTRMERSPRLNIEQLPKDRRLAKDALLRGASPEEVAGAIRAWLANERPSYRGVTMTLAADEEAILRIERRWQRICRANGLSELSAQINRTDRGITLFGEIVLMPDVVAELSSSSMYDRAKGAKTIMHEWWHASRRETRPFRSFEEGTADAFASRMAMRAFGLRVPEAWSSYPDLLEAIEQLIGAVPYLVRPLDRWGLADSSKGRK